jgi:hypothetical protein
MHKIKIAAVTIVAALATFAPLSSAAFAETSQASFNPVMRGPFSTEANCEAARAQSTYQTGDCFWTSFGPGQPWGWAFYEYRA